MILNCGGILIVYMVMICDILVGNEADGFGGVLPSLFGVHKQGSFVTSRSSVLAAVLLTILGPVASIREMNSVSVTSAVGLVSVLYLVLSITILCTVAAVEDKLSTSWTWLPKLDSLGRDVSDAVLQIVATVPVIMNAFICHQSVHPVMEQVRPLTEARMDTVLTCSLVLCCAFYVLSSASAYAVFGAKTQSDVLQNFTVEAMRELLPPVAATFVGYSVRLVFSVALMMAFPLSHFTYRDSLCEFIWGERACRLSTPRFFGITTAGLAVFYLLAITLPNIWLPLAVIGSTAGVTVAFVFPSLLMLTMDSHTIWRQVVGACLLASGLTVSISGLISTFYPLLKG